MTAMTVERNSLRKARPAPPPAFGGRHPDWKSRERFHLHDSVTPTVTAHRGEKRRASPQLGAMPDVERHRRVVQSCSRPGWKGPARAAFHRLVEESNRLGKLEKEGVANRVWPRRKGRLRFGRKLLGRDQTMTCALVATGAVRLRFLTCFATLSRTLRTCRRRSHDSSPSRARQDEIKHQEDDGEGSHQAGSECVGICRPQPEFTSWVRAS